MRAKEPSGARGMGVFEMIIVGPGDRVWPLMMDCEAVLAVYVEPAKESTDLAVG